jgi:hypothetical protein
MACYRVNFTFIKEFKKYTCPHNNTTVASLQPFILYIITAAFGGFLIY